MNMLGIMMKTIRKHKKIYNLLVSLFFWLKAVYYYVFLSIFLIFKIDNKKIIIENYYGKGFWDMGKYIYNELVKYGYKIYWPTMEKYRDSLNGGARYIKYDSIKYLYHLSTAKIWINNCRFRYGIKKKGGQFYIQTWHGCIALKKVESAVEGKLWKYYILSAKNDSKMANIFVSNSSFCTNFYKKYFRYNGKILEYWCPRNDIIVNNDKDIIVKVKQFFWLLNSHKICLYAPTFREWISLAAYNINYETLIAGLKSKFGWDWKLLIRLHPNISNMSSKLMGFNEDIINSTNYPDMQELLVATDFLITDYSSCIFDYALSRKPAMIYASDIEEYKNDRDFEIELEDTPFPIAMNNEMLEEVINSYDIDEYLKRLNKFYHDIWLKETGKSCQKIVEMINKITNDK